MILFAVLFGALTYSAHEGTAHYEECLKDKFKHGSCWSSEQLYKAGKFGCNLSKNRQYIDGKCQ